MRLSEEAKIFWDQLTGGQKAVIVGVILIAVAAFIYSTASSISTSVEIRKYEREANTAKRDAEDALKIAKKIATEKLEIEKKLAELEAKRDGKQTELEKAKIETLDARADYERALRERRGDNPSSEQLCAELAALGYPCG